MIQKVSELIHMVWWL